MVVVVHHVFSLSFVPLDSVEFVLDVLRALLHCTCCAVGDRESVCSVACRFPLRIEPVLHFVEVLCGSGGHSFGLSFRGTVGASHSDSGQLHIADKVFYSHLIRRLTVIVSGCHPFFATTLTIASLIVVSGSQRKHWYFIFN